jgi:hypothetical protein
MEGILGQDADGIELVGICDGASEDLLAVLWGHACKDPRMVLLVRDGIGEDAAEGLGHVWASADTLVFLGSDRFSHRAAPGPSGLSSFPERCLRALASRLRDIMRRIAGER